MLRAIEELATENETYTVSKSGKTYDFNTVGKPNRLLVELLLATGRLERGGEYDVDFDHQSNSSWLTDRGNAFEGRKTPPKRFGIREIIC